MKHALIIGCLMLLVGCASKGSKLLSQIDRTKSLDEIQDIYFYREGEAILRLGDGRTIQLIGIKVPEYIAESSAEQRITAIEYRGETRFELLQLLYSKHIRVEYDGLGYDKTKANAPLLQGYVYADDILVNAEMINRGYAFATQTASDSKYNTMFHSLEAAARREKRGLWYYINKPKPIAVYVNNLTWLFGSQL